MTVSLTTPVTGAAQTGFTTPAYVLTQDVAPDINGKQHAVTGLTGTQVGVSTHSAASPFTITFFRPKAYRSLGSPNPITGVVNNVPKNTYKAITRKGMLPLAGQKPEIMVITTTMDVPAGAEIASPAEIRAALSAHIGALTQQSAGLGDTEVTGIL